MRRTAEETFDMGTMHVCESECAITSFKMLSGTRLRTVSTPQPELACSSYRLS